MGPYNVTVSHNVADSDNNGSGDGLYAAGVNPITIGSSIVFGNTDNGGQAPNCGSSGLYSLRFNIIQSLDACALSSDTTGNRLGANPLLGPLADNGGPTWTMAIPAGSPAENAGKPSGCRDGAGALLTADQRGLPRWQRCDIGAFEFQPRTLFLPVLRR